MYYLLLLYFLIYFIKIEQLTRVAQSKDKRQLEKKTIQYTTLTGMYINDKDKSGII